MVHASGRKMLERVIGGILFLFTELGIICAAASVDHVSPEEGIDDDDSLQVAAEVSLKLYQA
jgi:hypothetical protein